MAWPNNNNNNNNFTGSTRYPTRRPSRPTYVPPVFRTFPNNNNNNNNNTTESNSPRLSSTRDDDNNNISDEFTNKLTINFEAYDDIPVDSTGEDIPPPVNSFDSVDLADIIKRNITLCKYVKPTPIQKHALPILVKGRDLMACAQTGSGKTAAFCFPIISAIFKSKTNSFNGGGGGGGSYMVASPLALILSPTRELSCQIYDEARKFASSSGLKIVVAYGGAPISNQFRNLERGVHILVATPGRLVDMIERGRVSLKKIKYLALDEADRMLDMGFEPQVRKIVQQTGMPAPGIRQTMLFSATFPSEIQRLASDFLSNYIFLSVGRVGSSTDLIEQRVEKVEEMNKRSYLMELLRKNWGNRNNGKIPLTIIFVETKKGADILERLLSMNSFPAIAIHGDKVQMERERALRSFKSGQTPILVATDVASRGLDIPHVAHVINFDMPKDIESYVHRIGRTGRAGKSGIATALFSDKNSSLASQLVELMAEAKQEVPPWLKEYAESSPYMNNGGSRGNSRSRFGGYDYRSHDYQSSYNNADSFGDAPAATSSDPYQSGTGYYDAGSVQPYDSAPNDFEPNDDSGWE
ncbi:hypothetical protein ACFE04_001446 [Oxalis oulophora]